MLCFFTGTEKQSIGIISKSNHCFAAEGFWKSDHYLRDSGNTYCRYGNPELAGWFCFQGGTGMVGLFLAGGCSIGYRYWHGVTHCRKHNEFGIE